MRIWDEILRLFGTSRVRLQWRRERGRRGRVLEGFPLVTATLLAACALLYYLSLQLSGEDAGLEPAPMALLKLGADLGPLVRDAGQWWRPLTSIFLHGDALHILFNVLALWTVGVVAEERFGRARAFAAFVVAGALGQWASVLWYRPTIGVGASGGIFGLIALCVVHAFRTRDTELRARFVPWLIYGLLLGFLSRGIDNAAHVGGLVTGGLLGLVLADERTARRAPEWLWNLVALALLGAVGAGFYLASQSAEELTRLGL
jgi:rhomboid protease GluP